MRGMPSIEERQRERQKTVYLVPFVYLVYLVKGSGKSQVAGGQVLKYHIFG